MASRSELGGGNLRQSGPAAGSESAWHRIDTFGRQPNNSPMARPEVARRVKSYSAATGYVYQYQFQETVKSRRGLASGTQYIYWISRDRQSAFPVRIFVKRSAVEKWGRRAGRAMTGTEEYAVAKLRLFQAFDDVEDLSSASADFTVDESNLETFLNQLDI